MSVGSLDNTTSDFTITWGGKHKEWILILITEITCGGYGDFSRIETRWIRCSLHFSGNVIHSPLSWVRTREEPGIQSL